MHAITPISWDYPSKPEKEDLSAALDYPTG